MQQFRSSVSKIERPDNRRSYPEIIISITLNRKCSFLFKNHLIMPCFVIDNCRINDICQFTALKNIKMQTVL